MGRTGLTFSELAAQLHSRAWGGLLFIFAAINVLPLPPGTSAFFALPLLIVSAQMVFGRATPWFPARIDRRGVTKQELGTAHRQDAVARGARRTHVQAASADALPGPTATRVIGLVCFLLALVAAIPIPLFHVAPAAAIVLFGLALIYRDGALVIAAAVAGPSAPRRRCADHRLRRRRAQLRRCLVPASKTNGPAGLLRRALAFPAFSGRPERAPPH